MICFGIDMYLFIYFPLLETFSNPGNTRKENGQKSEPFWDILIGETQEKINNCMTIHSGLRRRAQYTTIYKLYKKIIIKNCIYKKSSTVFY